MIISASYKTDIPAFYGRWFLNRLDAGYCLMVNPYGGQTHRIDLSAGRRGRFRLLDPQRGAVRAKRSRRLPRAAIPS